MMEWLTLLAILFGPIAAVQVQKWIERATETKRERLSIFRTLMRTRGNIMSREHVDALNMIPLVFSNKHPRDADVRRKWEIYLNHLNSSYPTDQSEAVQLDFRKRGLNHLVNLLISQAKAFGYKFDEEDMHRVYAPIGHAQEAAENQAGRQLLLRLLRGEAEIKTRTSIFPGDVQASKDFNDVLLAVLKGERALTFKAAPPDDSGPTRTYG